MRRGRTRRFTFPDALILAVGAGLGVWAGVAIDPKFLDMMWAYRSCSPQWRIMPGWLVAMEMPAKRVQADFIAFLVVLTLAAALATFRRRVGGRRRAWRSPGLAATATLSAAVAVRGATLAWEYSQGGWIQVNPTFWTNSLEYFVIDVTAALGGVWAYQLATGLWRPLDDWRDGLGRWLGGLWASMVASDILFLVLWG